MAAESVVGIRLTLDGAQQAEAGLRRVAVGMGQVEMSTKQLNAALRGIPAQMTDIATSLASGQAPLTVLLQQGGQLKDLFGSVGGAARAVGGYLLGLVNPYTVAAGAAAGLYVAFEAGRKESAMLDQALLKSGNIMGMTTGQLNDMARAMGQDGFSRGAAAEALAEIAGSGKVASGQLQQLTGVALDMDKYLGQSVKDTNKVFSDLANEPTKAVLKLNESMHFLTLQQYEHIKALEDQGRKTDAAAAAQMAYADAVKPAVDKAKENLGYLEQAWNGVASAATWAWDKMKGIGRTDTLNDELATARQRLEQLRSSSVGFGYTYAERQKEIQQTQEHIRMITSQIGAETRLAGEKARLQQLDEAGIAAAARVLAWQEKGLSKQEQMTKALAGYSEDLNRLRVTDPTNAKLDPEAVARGEQKIRDEFKETAKSVKDRGDAFAADRDAAKVWAQTWDEAGKLIEDATGKTLGLNKAQELLMQYLTSPAYQINSEAMRQVVLQRLYAADAAIKDAEATKQEAMAAEAAAKAVSSWAADRTKDTKALDDQIKARQDEISALGLSAEATAQFNAAKLEQAAAEKEAYAAALQTASFYAGDYQDAYAQAAQDALDQAAKLRQLVGLELEKGTAQAAVEARNEWKKSIEKIDDIFREGFAGMVNNGKSGWDAFTKSLTTTFKTAVADEIYKALAQPFVVRLVAAVTGVSAAGAASASGVAGGGGSGALGQAYNAYSTYSSLTSGAKWFTDFGGSITNLINQTGGKLFNAGLESVGETLMNFSNTYGQQITQFSNVAGNALGYLSAAYDLSQGKYGSAIGTAVGTYFGGPIGGAIGNMLGGVVDGIFGWGEKKTTYKFTTNSSQAPTKKVFEDGVYVASPYGNIGMADHYSNGIQASKYKDTFQAIANVDAGIAAGLTAAQNEAIKKALDGYTGGKMGTVDAYVRGRLQIITNTLGGVIDELADKFQGTTEQFAGYVTQLVQVQALIPSLTFLNKTLSGTSTEATQTAMALSTAFGGVSGANSVLSSYVQAFYTDSEKLALQTASMQEVFDGLGLAMPRTAQGFRALVESQDLTTDAGRQSYVALMAVSSAFAELTAQATAASGALSMDNFRTAADYQFAQITGQVPVRVPAFADGGLHSGGWAMVGERGPELVNLAPSRVYSNSDSKGLLDTSGLRAELAALRADGRANSVALVGVLKRVDKLFNRWDMNGMPEVRSVAV